MCVWKAAEVVIDPLSSQQKKTVSQPWHVVAFKMENEDYIYRIHILHFIFTF